MFRRRSPYYSLVIEGLSVGGSALSLPLGAFRNGYGAVLDSGTTFTYLPGPVWSQFEKQVRWLPLLFHSSGIMPLVIAALNYFGNQS